MARPLHRHVGAFAPGASRTRQYAPDSLRKEFISKLKVAFKELLQLGNERTTYFGCRVEGVHLQLSIQQDFCYLLQEMMLYARDS